MEIEFVNVPKRVQSWDCSILFDLIVNLQLLVRTTPKITEMKIDELHSKVHVLIHDFPEDMSPQIRKYTAMAVIRFLDLHKLGEGSDVTFVGFNSERMFTKSDF